MSFQPSMDYHNFDDLLYVPFNAETSSTLRFLRGVNNEYGLSLRSYEDLYIWSISHIDLFWGLVWDETGVIGRKESHVVDTTTLPPANPPWFKGTKLNWAENMLWCRSPDKTAIIDIEEPTPEVPIPRVRRVSYAELYELVADLVSALLALGLKPGDRIASYSSNCVENVAASLACAAIGCIWVSAAADFGPEGVLERFDQVQPKVIFAVDSVVYNAKVHTHLPKVSALCKGLAHRIGSVTAYDKPTVVIIQREKSNPSGEKRRLDLETDWIPWDDFSNWGKSKKLGQSAKGEIEWRRGEFDWPLWILFSSGTTGRPKPIVHRAGGMLLQAKKEFAICGGLTAEDVFFYYTTTGWMMWNFLVSGLSIGCTIVLYDGSPLKDPSFLWRLVESLRITIFGTSAKYIDALSKVYRPREHHNLQSLRHIYSTGSPLAAPLFDYVYKYIAPKVLLGSITGGTDICSLFAGMCDALPVYRGEIQCRMLGMAIAAFKPSGDLCKPGEEGELVCLKPFPCMPVGFWPLPGYGSEDAVKEAQKRYQDAYFAEFKNTWYHGDHVIITQSKGGNGGGLIMLGRSDGVLNPGGIRFGSSELYDVIASSPLLTAIEDYLAVGLKVDGGADERVILFVKLSGGDRVSPALEQSIKSEIRIKRSSRHVPSKIIQVDDIPYTLNGKRVEVPVKKIINGSPVSSINPATLRNPECLQIFFDIGQYLRTERF